ALVCLFCRRVAGGRLRSLPARAPPPPPVPIAPATVLNPHPRRAKRGEPRVRQYQTHRSRHDDPASRPLPKANTNMASVYTKASVFPQQLRIGQDFLGVCAPTDMLPDCITGDKRALVRGQTTVGSACAPSAKHDRQPKRSRTPPGPLLEKRFRPFSTGHV